MRSWDCGLLETVSELTRRAFHREAHGRDRHQAPSLSHVGKGQRLCSSTGGPERTATCQNLWGRIHSSRYPEPGALSTSPEHSLCT